MSGYSSEGEDSERDRKLEDALLSLTEKLKKINEADFFYRFSDYHPPTYDGVDPYAVEGWLRKFEKLFDITHCPEDQKLRIGTFYLEGQADNWWVRVRDSYLAQPGFNWDQFKESLKSRFYPDALQWQKQEELLSMKQDSMTEKERELFNLEQGSMTVEEYAQKFVELARFAPTVIPNEAARIRRFERKLNPRLLIKIVPHDESHTFQEAYEKALRVYDSVKAVEKEEADEAARTRAVKRTYETTTPPYKSSSAKASVKRFRYSEWCETCNLAFFSIRVVV